MILTRERILAEVDAGNVAIDPYDESMVGPASIDLHLGDELRLLDSGDGPLDVRDDTDYRDVSQVCSLATPYGLAPQATVLGVTRERIKLSSEICGWLEGRSRFARLGLAIHVTAGFINPGVENHQVLEISNLSGRVLNLHAGTRICQIILQRTDGSAVYRGRFASQNRP